MSQEWGAVQDHVTVIRVIPSSAIVLRSTGFLINTKRIRRGDHTIRGRINTYRFADHKEKVIDLLKRVTRMSVETMDITEAMRGLKREQPLTSLTRRLSRRQKLGLLASILCCGMSQVLVHNCFWDMQHSRAVCQSSVSNKHCASPDTMRLAQKPGMA
jgi:hypothetical protein